ncbi:forkhead box protein P3 isoform X2 [Clupea harengus]|nr:forkhead box protein P3 isoform X2 [Clupea harengus]XP_031422061.1 forkhead box protein P3 isoform X2 [Clupea harengus]
MRSRRGSLNSGELPLVCQDEPRDAPCSVPVHRQRHSLQPTGLATSVQISAPLMLRLSSPLIRSAQTSLLLQQCSSEEVGKQFVQLTSMTPRIIQSRPSVLRRPPHPLQQDQPRWSNPFSDEGFHVIRRYLTASVGHPSKCTAETAQSWKLSQHRRSRGHTHHEPSQSSENQSPLYVNGLCRWPGCEARFEDYADFQKHLISDHTFDVNGSAQWKIQRDLVQRMENQLVLEKKKLQAIECHLNLSDQRSTTSPVQKASSCLPASLAEREARSEGAYGASEFASEEPVERGLPKLWQAPLPHLLPDMTASFDVYKYTNIRPPYTYACLIRWSILEAPDQQRTLNEIYNWFMQMFIYFRHNNTAWKNAVRHNLSLHKCFVRVEGGKGAVWTVDETEFQKRKKQKFNRDYMLRWLTPY